MNGSNTIEQLCTFLPQVRKEIAIERVMYVVAVTCNGMATGRKSLFVELNGKRVYFVYMREYERSPQYNCYNNNYTPKNWNQIFGREI